MKSLNKDWLTESNLDFEYKKYVLLAYLQSVEKEFELQKLYPVLNDLIEHYRNLVIIKENANQLSQLMNKSIKQIDLKQLKFIYEKQLNNEGLPEDIENIIDFSIPHFKKHLEEGKKIYQFIEEQIHIEPLGLFSLNKDEGYLFLHEAKQTKTQVYQYQITIFDQPDEKYRAINTTFVNEYTLGLSNTFQTIKQDLIKTRKELPNPSTFVIESEYSFPLNESLLPVAKRMLVKYTATL